jgi:fatty-acid desaturase
MKHIRDCLDDPIVLFQHTHYFQFHLLCAAICIPLCGWVNYGYFFSLPIILILYGNAATNILGHQAGRGYRNFDTPDASVNIGGIVNFLLMGGGMQNNHHHAPSSHTTKVKSDESDSMGWIIEVFLKTPSTEVSLSENR